VPAPTTATGSPYDDDANVGAMARAILRSSPAKNVYIEIAYAPGERPSQEALDHVRSVLEREAAKPVAVEISNLPALPGNKSSYSLNDLADLESKYRSMHSRESVATIWIAALNGSYSGAENTLGLAFRATAVAIFEDQIKDAATLFVSAGAIERSVMTHEVGHLLGLVNLGYRSAYDHENPQHPHHSKYQTSVMYWAVEDMSIAAILSGGPPDDFDQYDRADLAALRSG
jgi:hypothetical protein